MFVFKIDLKKEKRKREESVRSWAVECFVVMLQGP